MGAGGPPVRHLDVYVRTVVHGLGPVLLRLVSFCLLHVVQGGLGWGLIGPLFVWPLRLICGRRVLLHGGGGCWDVLSLA